MKTTYLTAVELDTLTRPLTCRASLVDAEWHDVAADARALADDIRSRRTSVEWDGVLPLTIGVDARRSRLRGLLAGPATAINTVRAFARHVAAFRSR